MKDNFIRGDHAFWSKAMDAKYAGQGQSMSREDFDQLFAGEYMVKISSFLYMPEKATETEMVNTGYE